MSTLSMKRGGVAQWSVAVTTPKKVAVDLTGITAAKFVMRSSKPSSTVTTDADAALVASMAGGHIAVTSHAQGLMTVTVPHTLTMALEAKTYYYDLAVVISGQIFYVDTGTVEVETNYARQPMA